jgi:insulysin
LQPAGYVANLIGQEGKGSLLSLLKEKHLATDLEAGSWDNSRGFMALRVQIGLTPEGLNKTEDVICHVFQVKGQTV